MRLATRTQSLELDRRTQGEYGIDADALMERAVDALERALRRFYPAASGEQVWVVAGPGKNGEDGRRLADRVGARVFSCAEFLQIRFEAKLPTVVIDAILGIGQSRPPDGEILLAIHEINHLRAKGVRILAVDTPTGLDLDTGNVLGEAAVVANQTVTFGFAKPGFFSIKDRLMLDDSWLTTSVFRSDLRMKFRIHIGSLLEMVFESCRRP